MTTRNILSFPFFPWIHWPIDDPAILFKTIFEAVYFATPRYGFPQSKKLEEDARSGLILVGWIQIQEGKITGKLEESEEISCFKVLDVLCWYVNTDKKKLQKKKY